MKALTLLIIAAALVAAAYLAGYWPQHQRVLSLDEDLRLANSRLAEAQAEIRIYQLENGLLGLM